MAPKKRKRPAVPMATRAGGIPKTAGGKGRAPPGRPQKLTPAVQRLICDTVRKGNYLETAAAFAGVAKSTLHDWLKRGANQKRGKFREFSDAVREALAEADVLDVEKIHASRSWQAAAWKLERRHPEQFGRRSAVEVSGPGGAPVNVEHTNRGLLETLKRLAGETDGGSGSGGTGGDGGGGGGSPGVPPPARSVDGGGDQPG